MYGKRTEHWHRKLERQLWTPTDCKTPEQTLYGSIFREINTKENPRIVKSVVKGKFRIAE